VRAAYGPKPLKNPRDIKVDGSATDVGDNAWVGQALVQLYAKTSATAYLKGALEIATWIQKNTYDTRGSGGYTGGYTSKGEKIRWKSTEHNIDTYAFFTMLATESGERRWTSRASWAKRFVASMWSERAGRFYVGTLNDGITPNKPFKPEDVNSWSYLAFQNPEWAAAPSWDVTHLAVSKNGFSDVSFCSGDRSGVWFERHGSSRGCPRAAQPIRRSIPSANLSRRRQLRTDERTERGWSRYYRRLDKRLE
jgi:hypothetical protein